MDINHLNFRSKRKEYGISIKEIADESLLSEATIRNYEIYDGSYTRNNRVRDYNEKQICRALESLIQFKIDLESIKPIKRREKNTMKKILVRSVYSREKVYAIVNEYLTSNGIGIIEFMGMCDLALNTFASNTMEKYKTLYPRTVYKICKATGWDMSKFESCKIQLEQECETAVTDTNKKEEKIMETATTNEVKEVTPVITGNKEETRDHKFIFEDGCFYEEYTIIRRVRKSITRGAFMAAIEKEGK